MSGSIRMDIISSGLLHSTGLVIHGMSTRRGGVSPEPLGMNLSFNVGDARDNVLKNRGLFARALGIDTDQWAAPVQRHTTVVRRVETAGSYPGCDGLVTDTPGVYLAISAADCVPVFILDVRRKAIAAVHAGWRGTAGGIAGQGVGMLVAEFQCRSGDMVAFVGPGAGKCCYAVGEDVAVRFPQELVRREEGKVFVDLKAANVAQLVAAGIPRQMIEMSPHCTIHESALFHSYRREGSASGRMMGIIGLKAQG